MDKKTGYIIVSIFGAFLAVVGLGAMLVVWYFGLLDYRRNTDQAYERALHSNVEALTAAANDPKYQEQLRQQELSKSDPSKAADVPDKSVPDKLDLWGCIKMKITVRGKSCPTYTVCPVVNEYCYGGIKTPMKEEYFQVSRSIQKSKTEREQIHIIDCDAWMTTNMKTGNSFGLARVQTDAQ